MIIIFVIVAMSLFPPSLRSELQTISTRFDNNSKTIAAEKTCSRHSPMYSKREIREMEMEIAYISLPVVFAFPFTYCSHIYTFMNEKKSSPFYFNSNVCLCACENECTRVFMILLPRLTRVLYLCFRYFSSFI